ncbi:MAG: transketolase, partial [Anaerolineales bacterium]|nr:transketolase [Anaerolineales bacterium]
WKVALERKDGPTALVLTRQGLPQVSSVDNQLDKGAYVLSEPKWIEPEVVLIATGSEVEIAMEAKALLAEDVVGTRIVSMPSWELFEAQPEEYRNAVLPPNLPRLAIETGVSLGWSKYADAVIGLDHFGASAPYQTIYKEFGFTAENVAAKAMELLGK